MKTQLPVVSLLILSAAIFSASSDTPPPKFTPQKIIHCSAADPQLTNLLSMGWTVASSHGLHGDGWRATFILNPPSREMIAEISSRKKWEIEQAAIESERKRDQRLREYEERQKQSIEK